MFSWLLIFPFVSACTTLHSKGDGIELACCSSFESLPSNCEFSSICDGNCTCRLLISSNLICHKKEDANYQWRDHSTPLGELSCNRPKLPNPSSPYSVNIQGWNENITLFFNGICKSNITKLTIQADRIDGNLPNFGICFPSLEFVEIITKPGQILDISRLFSSSQNIYSLKLIGIDFEFPPTPPKWINSIEFLHIERSEIMELPKWMANAGKLTSLIIKYTKFNSIATATQMKALRSARLSHNRIDDLHRFAFSNKDLHDLDVSHNSIQNLATFTFPHNSNLRVLDLSSNPLNQLPFRPFLKNNRLKWLKLSNTRITTLTADNFVGLSSLKTLTLSSSPLQSIAPFAFLPLKNLRSLDLQSCNLTRIPLAVTQNCALTHLNLADNLLHRSSSLPPEVMALLSSLSQFRIEGNPLTEFPSSLFLLSTDNTRLYRQLVLTTTQLPLWTTEPCTPFYWHQHLRNKSLALRQLVSPWGHEKMTREGLGHCKEQYEWMSEQMTIYRDLERSSGCSVSRGLRSAMQKATSYCNNSSQQPSRPLIRPVPPPSPSVILLISLISNVVFLFIILLFICLIWTGGKRKY